MNRDTDFIYEAIGALQELVKLPVDVQCSRKSYDIVMDIRGEHFYGVAKKNAKNATYGILLSALEGVDSTKNTIIIADHLSKKLAGDLKNNNINYLDAAGNAYINTKDLFIFIEGQKSVLNKKITQGRLFQEAGLKLLLLLISNPELLEDSYRSLAEKAQISLGSVSIIFKELESQNYLLRTDQNRVLKNTDELIERWVLGYNEVKKPRIFKKTMRLIGDDPILNRLKNNSNLKVYFGGEVGGQLLTSYLKPQQTILYSNNELPLLGKHLKLVPDEQGDIELRSKFWSDEVKLAGEYLAPRLVIYADLMGTGNNRNIETAKLILENAKQRIY